MRLWRQTIMQRRLHCLALMLGALALSACGTATPDSAGDDPSNPAAGTDLVEVVGSGMVMQSSANAAPELCMGPVLTSYPPQCSGPVLGGLFSWDDVEAESQGGVRWTNGYYYGVGHYDQGSNTFMLTRPLSATPPDGFTPPEEEPVDFPQLCDDPFRGGDPDFSDPDLEKQNTFQERLEQLDGYVASYVSDGVSMFNVIVTGDADEAHATLREIWPGGLCVEQRDGPTQTDLLAAQAALSDAHGDLGLLGSGAGGMTGQLDVQVLLADDATIARIHELVEPWLTPDQVRITGTVSPLP